MHNKFLRTVKLLAFKLKAFNRTKPNNCTYGTVMTSRRASEVTAGANGMSTESNVTYKVYNNES